jgi:hypothetical protein
LAHFSRSLQCVEFNKVRHFLPQKIWQVWSACLLARNAFSSLSFADTTQLRVTNDCCEPRGIGIPTTFFIIAKVWEARIKIVVQDNAHHFTSIPCSIFPLKLKEWSMEDTHGLFMM